MPFIYRCEFLGDSWGVWEDGYEMPPLPYEFTQESCTVSFHTYDGVDWCFAYDPSEGLITWCYKEADGWSDWHAVGELSAPSNWILDDEVGIPSDFSIGTHNGEPVMFSYQAEDDSVYANFWSGDSFTDWVYIGNLEPPPNLSEASDVFFVGDRKHEWVISVDLEDWSVFYCEWDDDAEEFTAWAEAPPLEFPDEWYEMGGIDVDGSAGGGTFWLYATVYEDEMG